jgi:hypothetical protein
LDVKKVKAVETGRKQIKQRGNCKIVYDCRHGQGQIEKSEWISEERKEGYIEKQE